jgi:hypothetical protein
MHNIRWVDEDGTLHHDDYNMYHTIKDDCIFTVNNEYRYESAGQTASLVYRNMLDMLEISKSMDKTSPLFVNGDRRLQTNLVFRGPIYFLHDIMADHRRIFDHGDSYTAWITGKNSQWRDYCIESDLKKMMELQGFDVAGFCSNLYNYYLSALNIYQENPTEDNKAVIEQFENEIQDQEKISLYRKKTVESYSKEQLLNQLKRAQKIADKHINIARLYDIWLSGKDKGRSVDVVLKKRGCDKIAIYGMGLLGTRVYNELRGTDICALYGIDRKKISLSEEFHTFALDELDSERAAAPDAVVVTVFVEFDNIKKQLEEKGFKCVVCIDELLYALLQD